MFRCALLGCCFADATTAQVPDAIAVVATFHAKGARIYDCEADVSCTLAWRFRELIATLSRDGATVGRHYAGPNWEASNGSAVAGKAVAQVPGSTPSDIRWLKPDVIARRGSRILSGITTVQRINTHGGVVNSTCDTSRVAITAFPSVPAEGAVTGVFRSPNLDNDRWHLHGSS